MISHLPVNCCPQLLLYVVLPFWLVEHILVHLATSCHITAYAVWCLTFSRWHMQESVGIAKALAAKNGYEIDSNQEVSKIIDCCYSQLLAKHY
jgi:hypothetical protein